MNTADLSARLAERTGLSKTTTRQLLAAVVETIGGGLAAGNDVRLAGLGTLYLSPQAERSGTGPGGTPYHSPARLRVRLRPAKTLTDALAGA